MLIRVVYEDNTLDMIPPTILQLGIECKKIKMFYRESEKRWVIVGADPVRQVHNGEYQDGPDRRTIYSYQLVFNSDLT
jgi:hypothetical protein